MLMTEQEALEALNSGCTDISKVQLASHIARKALEKQIPKKPIYSEFEEDDDGENLIPCKATCPICGNEFEFGYWNDEDNHHCVCGQLMDWTGPESKKIEAQKKEVDEIPSRPYNKDEVEEMFLEHVRDLVDYWEEERRAKTSREKLDGLAFSMLVLLDGGSGGMPGYEVKAIGNEQDIEEHKEDGRNYYPLEGEDIAGALHEHYYND